MSQENQLTSEEAAELQRYNDSTQKAHEGLTEDNNKQIRSVLDGQAGAEKSADNRCGNITNHISRTAWLIIGAILIGTIFLGANSIRMHYSWSADVNNAHAAFNKANETNRNLALKYHKNRSEREAGLRDQIMKLNDEIEDNKKQKYALRIQLKKATDLNAEQSQIIANIKSQGLANQMLNEAYHTIAMNAVPLNLQQYISVASDEQWIGYAQMASDRNSDKVITTIASIPALMKIEKVASIVNDYCQAMLAKNNK